MGSSAADRGVMFAAVNLSEANDLTVGIMALVAQAERQAISNAPVRRSRWPGAAACVSATPTAQRR
jgi:hypothetical protein